MLVDCFRKKEHCPAAIRVFRSLLIFISFQTQVLCSDFTHCIWKLPNGQSYLDAYFVVRIALGFFIPLVVIVVCYVFIIIKLRNRPENLGASGTRINSQQNKVSYQLIHWKGFLSCANQV